MDYLDTAADTRLKELFLNILNTGDIKTVFQPIISLRDGTAFGYEALSRGPENSEMHNPATLFQYAEQCNSLWELELLCRSKALQAVHNAGRSIKLFLNVNPNVMHDLKFRQGFTKDYLKEFSLDPENIIFEINEKSAITNIAEFRKTVSNYKDQNYKIAIDDAGAGYSGLNMISDIHPHFLKLDMNLIREIDKDYTKQALVKSMVEFSKLSNTLLIAEGIETENELAKLIEIGVHYGQGFFIQRPASSLSPISESLVHSIHEINMRKNHLIGNRISDIYIGNVSTCIRTVNPGIQVYQVNEMMRGSSSIPGFCVTENESVTGVITREHLNAMLGGQYGYSLYYKKPISEIMSRDFMSVDFQMPIDIVAKAAMQRSQDKLYNFITVTKDDKYFGIVTVRDLLEKSIEIEVTAAKHQNPLSELPGNPMIEKHLENCIKLQQPYCVLYFDIDNFKSYNDVYGFEKGDVIIKQLTKILKEHIPSNEFIGHIGGDDFIAILVAADPKIVCDRILAQFDQMAINSYNQEDAGKGFILTKNRHGIEESFPLMSISIAGIRFTGRRFTTVFELSEMASVIKKKCKQCIGSACIIEEF